MVLNRGRSSSSRVAVFDSRKAPNIRKKKCLTMTSPSYIMQTSESGVASHTSHCAVFKRLDGFGKHSLKSVSVSLL